MHNHGTTADSGTHVSGDSVGIGPGGILLRYAVAAGQPPAMAACQP